MNYDDALIDEHIRWLKDARTERDQHMQNASDLAKALSAQQDINAELLAALEALSSWQDKLSLSDRHATADQARAWSLDCRCASVLIIRAKNGPK